MDKFLQQIFKIVLLGLNIIPILNSYCQQLPQYTNYTFNSYLINPAISGIENYIDLKTNYRKQWQGINGAPETKGISIHFPIGKEYGWSNANSFGNNENNPLSRSYLTEYRASEPHHGFGIAGYIDKSGPLQNTNANISYAYHLGLAPKCNLAVGISGGIDYISFNRDNIKSTESYDEALHSNLKNDISPNLGIGVWFYTSRYFAGLSALQLLGSQKSTNQIAASPTEIYHKVPHYYFTTGYKGYISEDIALMPSILIQTSTKNSIEFDINSKVSFRDKFWLGASLRKDDSYAVFSGFNFNHLINMGYSFDFTASELQKVTSGTHEIFLGLLLNNRYKVSSKQRFW